MNKKAKLIAPILCGVLLSSNLPFTNVQASTNVKNNVKTESNIRSIIPANQKYSVYCELPGNTLTDVERYIRRSLQDNVTPNSDGVRNVLIQHGISRTVANNISFSLLDLSVKSHNGSVYHSMFPETNFMTFSHEMKDIILSDGNERFSLAVADPTIKSYSTYGILSNRDLVNFQKNINSNPQEKEESPISYAERIITKSNIVEDKAMIKKLADVMQFLTGSSTDKLLQDCIELNEDFIVLLSDNNEKVVITRQAR